MTSKPSKEGRLRPIKLSDKFGSAPLWQDSPELEPVFTFDWSFVPPVNNGDGDSDGAGADDEAAALLDLVMSHDALDEEELNTWVEKTFGEEHEYIDHEKGTAWDEKTCPDKLCKLCPASSRGGNTTCRFKFKKGQITQAEQCFKCKRAGGHCSRRLCVANERKKQLWYQQQRVEAREEAARERAEAAREREEAAMQADEMWLLAALATAMM